MQVVKRVLLIEGQFIEGCIEQNTFEHLYESRFHEVVSCGKIKWVLDEDDLNELRHLTFKETKGEQSVEDGPITNGRKLIPLKLWKYNIGTDEKLKLALIEDYWDEESTKEIFDLLRE